MAVPHDSDDRHGVCATAPVEFTLSWDVSGRWSNRPRVQAFRAVPSTACLRLSRPGSSNCAVALSSRKNLQRQTAFCFRLFMNEG